MFTADHLFLFGVLPVEALDAAFGVGGFLRAGKEGMAGAANIQADFRQHGTGDKLVTADAADGNAIVGGVDISFHKGNGSKDLDPANIVYHVQWEGDTQPLQAE